MRSATVHAVQNGFGTYSQSQHACVKLRIAWTSGSPIAWRSPIIIPSGPGALDGAALANTVATISSVTGGVRQRTPGLGCHQVRRHVYISPTLATPRGPPDYSGIVNIVNVLIPPITFRLSPQY